MNFKDFITNYLFWFTRITLLLFCVILAFSPIPLAIILCTFVNPTLLWLMALLLLTFPLGLFLIIKVGQSVVEK